MVDIERHLMPSPRWNVPMEGSIHDMIEYLGDTPFGASEKEEHIFDIPSMFVELAEMVSDELDPKQYDSLGHMHDIHDNPEMLLDMLNSVADSGIDAIYTELVSHQKVMVSDHNADRVSEIADSLNKLAEQVHRLHALILEQIEQDRDNEAFLGDVSYH